MNKQEFMKIIWTGTLRVVLVILLILLARKGNVISIFFMIVLVDVYFYWRTKLNDFYNKKLESNT